MKQVTFAIHAWLKTNSKS